MIMEKSVKTEQRAIEILQEWLTENITEKLLNADTTIEDCEIEVVAIGQKELMMTMEM